MYETSLWCPGNIFKTAICMFKFGQLSEKRVPQFSVKFLCLTCNNIVASVFLSQQGHLLEYFPQARRRGMVSLKAPQISRWNLQHKSR